MKGLVQINLATPEASPMFDLKPIAPDAVPAALEKAHRYRLLNQPEQAESICEDVLQIDQDNQQAIVTLLLARTDRFTDPRPASPHEARGLISRLHSEYEREYYAGIVAEREGIAWLRSGKPRAGRATYECLREAMECYERAEAVRPEANDDALLRWNSCARLIMAHPDLVPDDERLEVAASLGE